MPLSSEEITLRAGPRTLSDDGSMPLSWVGTIQYAQTGARFAALTRGVTAGTIATMATSQSPTSVDVRTTAERTLTPYIGSNTGTGMSWLLTSGDFPIVNKPTAQAGLGIGNVRVSGNNAVVTFSNWTAATITPTAGQKYGIVAIRGLNTITAVLTPAQVAAATTAEQQFTVAGMRAGEVLAVSKPTAQATLEVVGCRVVKDDVVAITFGNASATTPVTPTAGETYTFFSTGGIDAAGNILNVQQNIGASGGPTGTAVAALGVTMTGLATTDAIVGVSKPTLQAGAALMGGFTSAADVLGLTFWENAATVTPTAGEVYSVALWRPNPAAPAKVYSVTLTPAAVAANTTAEQGFTVTGLVASSVVIVNKGAGQAGLGIVGARVSGANALAITFCNATAATITPTAGETYLVANFQQPIPDAGSAWVYQASQQAYQNVILSDAIQAALVSLLAIDPTP